MTYGEFLSGTGCKANDHNYKVFENLNNLYMMNDTATKEEVYKMAVKFLDNSESPEIVALKEKVNEEITALEKDIEYYSERIETITLFLSLEDNTESEIKEFKQTIKTFKQIRLRLRQRVNGLKWSIA